MLSRTFETIVIFGTITILNDFYPLDVFFVFHIFRMYHFVQQKGLFLNLISQPQVDNKFHKKPHFTSYKKLSV